jgi:hypothetical protein
LTNLNTDSNADADDEDGDCELVEDAEGAVDVPEDFFAEERFHQNGKNSNDVHDVQDRDARDHGRHERLQVPRFPKLNCFVSIYVACRLVFNVNKLKVNKV